MLYEVVYGDYNDDYCENYLTVDKQNAIKFAEKVYEKIKRGIMCDYVQIREYKLGNPCKPTTDYIWVFSYEDSKWYNKYEYSEKYLKFKFKEVEDKIN